MVVSFCCVLSHKLLLFFCFDGACCRVHLWLFVSLCWLIICSKYRISSEIERGVLLAERDMDKLCELYNFFEDEQATKKQNTKVFFAFISYLLYSVQGVCSCGSLCWQLFFSGALDWMGRVAAAQDYPQARVCSFCSPRRAAQQAHARRAAAPRARVVAGTRRGPAKTADRRSKGTQNNNHKHKTVCLQQQQQQPGAEPSD